MPSDKRASLIDLHTKTDHTPISAEMRTILEGVMLSTHDSMKAHMMPLMYGTYVGPPAEVIPEQVKVAVKRRARSTTIKAIGLDTNLPFRSEK